MNKTEVRAHIRKQATQNYHDAITFTFTGFLALIIGIVLFAVVADLVWETAMKTAAVLFFVLGAISYIFSGMSWYEGHSNEKRANRIA